MVSKKLFSFPLTASADSRRTLNVKGNTLNLNQVIALMKQRQGKRSQKQFADELGISAQFLCDIYQGHRTPGEKILSRLGLSSRLVYERTA